MFVFIFSLFLVLKNNILLLEFSFPFVRPSVPIFDILSMGGAAAAAAGANRATMRLGCIMDTSAWVTRPERPKGAKDEVKKARRAAV